jgi:hypothetical protein
MKEKKYILCARGSFDVNGGKASYDQGTPQDQTEAATELIFNRLFLIHLLQTKQITKQHIIVTLPERKFLYENIFDNVINYERNFIRRYRRFFSLRTQIKSFRH